MKLEVEKNINYINFLINKIIVYMCIVFFRKYINLKVNFQIVLIIYFLKIMFERLNIKKIDTV